MTDSVLKSNILSARLIPNASTHLLKQFNVQNGHVSLGVFTADSDDVAYTALDEATKKADIAVAYAKSFYGGTANANTKLAGEMIGVISAKNPADVKTGLEVIANFIEHSAYFISANEDGSIAYFAHCVSRTGSFLSNMCGIEQGASIAYLIAPPLEAMYALDVALKATDTTLVNFYGPPTETNFGGGILTGSQASCKAATQAFATAVKEVAKNPIKI
jgi:ethanolamine utilization protein EutL